MTSTPTRTPGTTSRRRMLAAAATGSAVALAGGRWVGPATAQEERIVGPNWSFAVHRVLDPYTGVLDQPLQEDAPLREGTPTASPRRVVAFEVEIDNAWDQALDFSPSALRLRESSGFEWRGGLTLGLEPRINARLLNPGERSRGWVWFTVPEAAELVHLAYVAPSPEFRVALGAPSR